MKIVIDIPETAYEAYKEWHKNKVATVEQSIIANGTPLPKGHGRLKDLDALKTSRIWALVEEKNAHENEIAFAPLVCVLKEDIDNAMTIIEADKKSEADNE